MKTAEFNKSNCGVISKDILAAIQEVAAKHGINIRTGNGSFRDNNFTLKLEMATISEGGEIQTKAMQDFKDVCRRYGLVEEDLGRTFKCESTGKTYTIVGAKPRSYKYPILCKEHGTGKLFKLPVARVQRGLTV